MQLLIDLSLQLNKKFFNHLARICFSFTELGLISFINVILTYNKFLSLYFEERSKCAIVLIDPNKETILLQKTFTFM